MENLFACPKCKSSDFKPFLQCVDYTVTKEKFNIVSCKQCGFKFTNPRPDSKLIHKYYESENYISHSNTNSGIFNKLYHSIKKIAIKNKICIIEELHPKNKTLLDIGCGTGSFLGAIQTKGWNVKGIEPNEKARNTAIETHSINVLDETELINLPKNSFSVITLWHVMEHVHNIKQRTYEIYNLLETGGYAIIAVPNHTSWDAKHYGEYWAAYDVPRHLSHFSPQTIKELFKDSNLKHVKSLPMKFDSYYVSLQSEKYRNSFLQPLKALLIGLYSNIKANKNAENYSSVIYIFKKT